MDDNNYQIDKSALSESQTQRAIAFVSTIETLCNYEPVSFVKSTYQLKKMRDRKTEPEISVAIGLVFAQAASLSGIKGEIEPPIVSDLVRMIFVSFPELAIEEIVKAFQLERYGDLNPKTEHFQLFNSDYVSAVLKKYKVWKSRLKAEHNITNEKPIEVNKEEIQTVKVAGIIDCYECWNENGKVEDIRFNVFDMLYAIGKIPKQDSDPRVTARYNAVIEQARNEKLAELTSERIDRKDNRSEVKAIQGVYNEIKSGIGNHLNNRIKALVLAGFFRKLNLDGNGNIDGKGRERLEEILRENFENL